MGGKLSLYKTNWMKTERRSLYRQKDIKDIFFHESARMRAESSSRRFVKSGPFYSMSHWAFLFLTDLQGCVTLLSSEMANARICGDLWRSVWHSPTIIYEEFMVNSWTFMWETKTFRVSTINMKSHKETQKWQKRRSSLAYLMFFPIFAETNH